MFCPDGIVVTSIAMTYLTLQNESKGNQGQSLKPMRYYQDAPNERFGGDVVFGSDATGLKSPTATYLTLKSRSKVNQVHCP